MFYLDSSLESKTKFKRISSLSDLVLKVELENNLEELKLPQVLVFIVHQVVLKTFVVKISNVTEVDLILNLIKFKHKLN